MSEPAKNPGQQPESYQPQKPETQPALEWFEIVKCGPYRFIGRSVYARAWGPNDFREFLWKQSVWEQSDKIFKTLDGMKEYISDEPHDAAIVSWEKWDMKEELETYTVGRFMKAGTPVPHDLDYIDIPCEYLAKGYTSGSFSERSQEILMEIEDAVGSALWKREDLKGLFITAEMYPKPDADGNTRIGIYHPGITIDETGPMALTDAQKETLAVITKKLDDPTLRDRAVPIDFKKMRPFNRGSKTFEVTHADKAVSLKVEHDHHNGYLLSRKQFTLPLIIRMRAKTDKRDIHFGSAQLTILLDGQNHKGMTLFVDDAGCEEVEHKRRGKLPVDEFMDIECYLGKEGVAVRVNGELWQFGTDYKYVKKYTENESYSRRGSVYFGTAYGSTVTVESLRVTEI